MTYATYWQIYAHINACTVYVWLKDKTALVQHVETNWAAWQASAADFWALFTQEAFRLCSSVVCLTSVCWNGFLIDPSVHTGCVNQIGSINLFFKADFCYFTTECRWTALRCSCANMPPKVASVSLRAIRGHRFVLRLRQWRKREHWAPFFRELFSFILLFHQITVAGSA